MRSRAFRRAAPSTAVFETLPSFLCATALAVLLSAAPAPDYSFAFAAGPDEEQPVRKSAEYMQAEALVKAESYELALEKLQELAEDKSRDADVHNLLGFAARNVGDIDTAEAAYARALDLNPDHRGALEYQGEMFLTLDQPARAEANLKRLIALCPNGCAERDDLAGAVSAWRAENGS